MRKRARIVWVLTLAMLASPLHCLGEALARSPEIASTLSFSTRRRAVPVMDVRMCCHPTEGVAPASTLSRALQRVAAALTPVVLPVTGGLLIERRVLSRSPGPPGDRLLAAHVSALAIPLLI